MLLFGFEMPKLFVYRTIFGVVVALVVGIILDIICKDAVLKEEIDNFGKKLGGKVKYNDLLTI